MKLLLIALITSFIGCSSAPKPLDEETLDISDFDFSTSITAILPDSYRSEQYGNSCYNVPQTAFQDTNQFIRDSIWSWEDSDELLWIEYQQMDATPQDEYLRFEGQVFNTACFMTSPDGKMMIVGGGAQKISEAKSRMLLERVTQKYGKPEHKRASFSGEYDLYTWTLHDRTIQYAVVFTDESNVLKIEIERNEKGELTNLSERERESYFNGYIFIIDAPWVEKIHSAGEVTGDFVYCQ